MIPLLHSKHIWTWHLWSYQILYYLVVEVYQYVANQKRNKTIDWWRKSKYHASKYILFCICNRKFLSTWIISKRSSGFLARQSYINIVYWRLRFMCQDATALWLSYHSICFCNLIICTPSKGQLSDQYVDKNIL